MQGYRGHREASRSPKRVEDPEQWKPLEGGSPSKVGPNVRRFLCGLLIVFSVGLYMLVIDFVRSLPGEPLVVTVNHSWINRGSRDASDLLLAEDEADIGVGYEVDEDGGAEIVDAAVMEERHTVSWRRMGNINIGGAKKTCATVEEMGNLTVGTREGVDASSLKIRRIIHEHFAVHGAEKVRTLPAKELCQQGFVAESLLQRGLGNCLYRTVNAAALSVMLGRSLILSEQNGFDASFDPSKEDKFGFQDYIVNSKEAFTMREVKRLWAMKRCKGRYKRPLVVRSYDFREANKTAELCDDVTKWKQPIIRYESAEDSVPIQAFLKSRVPAVRAQAHRLLGPTNDPDQRPNLFGELLNFVHSPSPAIEEAVNWTLGGGRDPDIAVHLRVMHMMDEASETSAWCVEQVLQQFPKLRANGKKPRVAVVSDTVAAVSIVKDALGPGYEVVSFDFKAWLAAFPNHKTMNGNKTRVPEKRAMDWGPAPRWVGIVDFYLAARARVAVISAARRRVATTFIQLAAASAAARQLREERNEDEPSFRFFSSFQEPLVRPGLMPQSGRSFAWHPFASNLSCYSQQRQCAPTALLPYGWYDAPWQAPGGMLDFWADVGVSMSPFGEITPEAREEFCNRTRSNPLYKDYVLPLPTLER